MLLVNKNDDYEIKIPNEELKDIDIYNKRNVHKLVRNIYNKFLKSKNLKGLLLFDIYVNEHYGIIGIIKNIEIMTKNKNIEAKIHFHLESTFLYKIDDYFLYKKLPKCNYYYYDGNIYIELTKNIKQKTKILLIEISEIIYGYEALHIINKGIKLHL